MSQVYTGAYVSLLVAPGKTEHNGFHQRDYTTYILRAVSIATHTYARCKSIGHKKKREKEKGRKGREEKKKGSEKGKERKKRQGKQEKTRLKEEARKGKEKKRHTRRP